MTRTSLVVLPLALALAGTLAVTAAAAVVRQTVIELVGMVMLIQLSATEFRV